MLALWKEGACILLLAWWHECDRTHHWDGGFEWRGSKSKGLYCLRHLERDCDWLKLAQLSWNGPEAALEQARGNHKIMCCLRVTPWLDCILGKYPLEQFACKHNQVWKGSCRLTAIIYQIHSSKPSCSHKRAKHSIGLPTRTTMQVWRCDYGG